MASAQVLPNSAASSRKQEHLEAGKRRLEEFRKKKAAELAKKAGSSSHVHNSDASFNKKQPSEVENVRVNESDAVTASDGVGGVLTDASTLGNSDKTLNLFSQSNQGSLASRTSLARNDLSTSSTTLVEAHSNSDEAKRYNSSAATVSADFSQNNETHKVNDIHGIHAVGIGGYGTTKHQSIPFHAQVSQDFDSYNTSQSSIHGRNDSQSNKSSSSVKDYAVADNFSSYFPSKILPQNSVDALQQIKPTNSSSLDGGYSHSSLTGGFSDSLSSKFRETITGYDNDLPSLHGATIPKYDSIGYEARNSSNHTPIHSLSMESSSRRSRPSFLDSLNVTRPPLGPPFNQPELGSSMSNHLQSSSNDISGSTYFRKPSEETKTVPLFSNVTTTNVHSPLETTSVVNDSNQDALMISANENGMEKKHHYYSPQNEDFAALEQHIEDLTQEKFSLQRALEASQALAESLATENSTLTDNYNQQRSVVNQLKSDMEMLQEDIKAQLVELESIRNEYTNARLECNAADERAKLLASEVIGLEEKALRLRSSELKLEKQLENAQAEISSNRKKMSSLDKERHDLQSTIDALQEEKKMLLSKLRKASGIAKSIERQTSKIDVSTSTEDLANEDPASNSSNPEINDNAAEASSLSSVPETGNLSFGVSPLNIPHDQMRVIENINALISELALEKEELIRTLASESSECSRMKEINKELSRKLEVQTQRLELLTAQSMVNENISAKPPDSHVMYENTPYADEGDEVVERVLGWIMKLFPGGPSRRRTSKLL
ncbi:protein BLISTER [Abrus precatorius]|uniref:Protein BLISTER n=1 Tax=Abrus precatorius TaxID=3816 RepID=A0A8B8M9E1_ABRPR|nr:protein BLISTER [Abrus precatorius]XP_027363675.1 protein BLISTER [Abrus precatorius]